MTKQSITLKQTLEEKKRLKELYKTNPEEAVRQLEEMSKRKSHRPQGISSANAAKARRFKNDYCEKCGATQKLLVHHINENQSDNKPQNLQTLCATCHRNYHFWRD